MNAIVILNGMPPSLKLFNSLFKKQDLYCCDGGANFLYDINVQPKLIVGDLDSISDKARDYFLNKCEFISFPCEKDKSDSELLFDKISSNYTSIYVLGGTGKRLDHTIFNVSLLIRYPNLIFVDDMQTMFAVNGTKEIKNHKGSIVSVFVLSGESSVTLDGFKYSGRDIIFKEGSSLGLSNEIISDNAILETSSTVIVVINK